MEVFHQKAFIQFSQILPLPLRQRAIQDLDRVQHLEELYRFSQEKNAEMVVPLTNQPWRHGTIYPQRD